jgi:ABC-type sugar transport system permease subunit
MTKPATRRRAIKGWRIRQELQWYSFILPSIICLVVLTYKPTLESLQYSFYKVASVGLDKTYIGFKNYSSILYHSQFQQALGNTVILALMSLLVIPMGFVLATLVNGLGRTKTQSFFRVAFYMPNILTGVSVVMMFQFVFRQSDGLLNSFLSVLAGRPVAIGWLTNQSLTKISASIISVWGGLGYNMLINLAGLQSIPTELYEAASIDGSNTFMSWRHITIPNMKKTFSFLMITNIIGGFSRFSDLYMLGGNSASGKPGGSLQTIMMYIYQYSFENPNYGISPAGCMVLFAIVFCITMVELKMTGYFKKEES